MVGCNVEGEGGGGRESCQISHSLHLCTWHMAPKFGECEWLYSCDFDFYWLSCKFKNVLKSSSCGRHRSLNMELNFKVQNIKMFQYSFTLNCNGLPQSELVFTVLRHFGPHFGSHPISFPRKLLLLRQGTQWIVRHDFFAQHPDHGRQWLEKSVEYVEK